MSETGIREVIQGDCLIEMDKLIDRGIVVDAIITDPPYGVTDCKWDSVIPFEDMWPRLNKLVKKNGAIVLFGSEPFSSALRMSNIKQYRYDWIWHKNFGGGFVTTKRIPMKRHEIISIFYKKQPVYNPIFQEYSELTKKQFKDGEKVNRKKQVKNSTNTIYGGLSYEGEQGIEIKRGKYPESVQFFKSVPNSSHIRVHPTQKPEALMEYLIKTYTNEGDLVLDFTAGSGTTGVACVNEGRNYILIEKEEEYVEIAKKRLAEIKYRQGSLFE